MRATNVRGLIVLRWDLGQMVMTTLPRVRRISKVVDRLGDLLYKHVTSKDDLLGGMLDAVLGDIGPPVPGSD